MTSTGLFPIDNRKVHALLGISSTEARRLAPARISVPWPGFTPDDVRRYLAASYVLSQRVNGRLDTLNASSRPEVVWNGSGSPELTWFGDFSNQKLHKITHTFRGIARHLSSPRLEVIGNNATGYSGMAIPFIEKIWLGKAWHSPGLGANDDNARILTLVHEAAHICGRFAPLEHYGIEPARGLLQWTRRAMRNAENYAFYAFHVLDRECVA